MANPFFSAMGGQSNILQMVNQLKANPMQFLIQRKFNLPQNIDTSNPQAIINHLVQSGQISQEQMNRAYNMAKQFGSK